MCSFHLCDLPCTCLCCLLDERRFGGDKAEAMLHSVLMGGSAASDVEETKLTHDDDIWLRPITSR